MLEHVKVLPEGKKIFFASDFHLGVPDYQRSLMRERKIIRWLENIEEEAYHIFLLGDIFDFWFEYRHTIPKGYVRLLGKLASMTDKGIPITVFTGNHDMWLFDYFPKELNIPVERNPRLLQVGDTRLLIGHGDGLGPGDLKYKIIKKVFASPLCQGLFACIHPNLGIGLANFWSKNSRLSNSESDAKFYGEKEMLWQYCKKVEYHTHHDYYIFGHRHLPLSLPVGENSHYYNLGEWVNHCKYGVYDGASFQVIDFEPQ